MKRLFAVLTACMMALSATGCNQSNATDPTDAEEVVVEDKIIHLQMRDADTLDILTTQRQSVRDALLCIYEPLFNIDSTFGLRPVLGEGYAFNESATVMTLKIKEGVLWHNNRIFTSEDVIYTINRIKSNPQSSYYVNLESVDRVERSGDYEVVFYLNKPNAFLPYSLYFPIMMTNGESEALIGTGPFVLKENDGKRLVLVKNGAWHKGDVAADGVNILYMRNAAMAQEAFSSGKIHAVTKDMLDIENFAIKEENTIHLYPDGLFEFVGFNASEGIFTDPLLRIGASSAINRNNMTELFGNAIASGFPIMPGSSAFSPSYEMSEYNLEYAREVIFSAGWSDINGDGVPEKVIDDYLTELKCELLVADTDKLREKAAFEVEKQLEMAGFKVDVTVLDSETYKKRIEDGEYDAFLGAVYYGDPYDVSDILASYGSVNYSGYSSSDMDRAIDDFSSASSVEKGTVAFSKLQSLYAASQPMAGIAFRQTYVVTSPYIEGEIEPYPYSPYANIASWNLVGIDKGNE